MNTKLLRLSFIAVAGVFFAMPLAAQQVGSTRRISLNAANGSPNADSGSPIISTNGRYVAFRSAANNLVPSDTNGFDDVYVRDLNTNLTSRLSVLNPAQCGLSGNTVQGDGSSTNPAISYTTPNGFYAVAFESDAENLTCFTDANTSRDVFISLPLTGFVERLSIPDSLADSDGNSFRPSVTIIPEPNTALVAFTSNAENLVSSDTNGFADIFLVTVTPQSATTISRSIRIVSKGSAQSDGDSDRASLSADGRFIVFQSQATNLIPGTTTSGTQIFLFEIATGSISLISKTAAGAAGNDDSGNASISYSGRYISYATVATDIVPGGAPGVLQIIRFDRQTGESKLLNVTSAGVRGNGSFNNRTNTTITADGRFVTFTDNADNLVSNDTNNTDDVFVRDAEGSALSLVTRGSDGNTGDSPSSNPGIGGDKFNSLIGSVSYLTASSNIVPATSGLPEVLLTGITTTALPFIKGVSQLEVPPDVAVTGRRANLTLRPFAGFLQAAGAQATGTLAAKQAKVSYDIKISKTTNPNRVVQRLTAKKNTISAKGLANGTYIASYRTIATRGTKTVARSPFSPAQRFSVG